MWLNTINFLLTLPFCGWRLLSMMLYDVKVNQHLSVSFWVSLSCATLSGRLYKWQSSFFNWPGHLVRRSLVSNPANIKCRKQAIKLSRLTWSNSWEDLKWPHIFLPSSLKPGTVLPCPVSFWNLCSTTWNYSTHRAASLRPVTVYTTLQMTLDCWTHNTDHSC